MFQLTELQSPDCIAVKLITLSPKTGHTVKFYSLPINFIIEDMIPVKHGPFAKVSFGESIPGISRR